MIRKTKNSKKDIVLLFLFFVVISTFLFPWNIFLKFLFCLYLLPIVLKEVKFDRIASGLSFFSLTYSVIGLLNGSFTLLFFSYAISPVSFYLFGKYVVFKFKTDKFLITIFLLTVLFQGLYVYIGTLMEMFSGLLISPTRTIEFGYLAGMKATLVSCAVSLGYCGLPIFLFSGNQCSIYQKYLFLLCFVLTMMVMLHLTSRTGFALSLFSLVGGIVYSSYGNKKRLFVMLALLIFVSFVLFLQFEDYFEEVIASFEHRNEYSSIEDGGGRLFRWVDGIQNVFLSPLGWNPFYHHVHNFWLDVARVAGVVPFTALVVANIISLVELRKLYNIKDDAIVLILFLSYLCFFSSCFVEPVLEGLSTYVYLFFMLWGMISMYLKSNCSRQSSYEKKRHISWRI